MRHGVGNNYDVVVTTFDVHLGSRREPCAEEEFWIPKHEQRLRQTGELGPWAAELQNSFVCRAERWFESHFECADNYPNEVGCGC